MTIGMVAPVEATQQCTRHASHRFYLSIGKDGRSKRTVMIWTFQLFLLRLLFIDKAILLLDYRARKMNAGYKLNCVCIANLLCQGSPLHAVYWLYRFVSSTQVITMS